MMSAQDLVDERHGWILDQLAVSGKVLTNDAAAALDVSVDSVRRDLRTLHDRGLLRRVHGGAVRLSRLPNSFLGRSTQDDGAARLAAMIVDRFRAGQVIGLDAGSTCVAVAATIPQTLAVTIVTNSPAAAVALAGHTHADVVLLGGVVDLNWMATVGPDTVDAWRNYRLDLAVVGVCGFDTTHGASTNSHAEVATKRALMAAAGETIVPVNREKVGTAAPFVICAADEIDTLIVEPGKPG